MGFTQKSDMALEERNGMGRKACPVYGKRTLVRKSDTGRWQLIYPENKFSYANNLIYN